MAAVGEQPYVCAICHTTGPERAAKGDRMNHIFCDPERPGSFWLNRCGECQNKHIAEQKQGTPHHSSR